MRPRSAASRRPLRLEPLEDRRMLAIGADFDFGDAPAPYPSTLAEAGPRHEAIGPTLGAARDAEPDGQPTAAADGDGADEDGVTFGPIRVGQLDATLTVNIQNAPNGAKLDAWIDFNGDGSWGGPGEQIFDRAPVNNGDNTLEFDVPSWANSGNTYARFRLSTEGDLGIGGLAADGEVEDYPLTINPPATAPGLFPGRDIISTATRKPYSVFAADVDGDGDIDVLSASSSDDTIAWYENDGGQGFTSHTISSTADRAQSVFAADVDGDGDIDVLSASFGDDKIAWYENDGSGGFAAHTVSTTANGARSVFAADVDGDGDVDVLSASSFDNKIAWYENDGSGGFTAHTISTTAMDAQSVFAVDVDGDGDMDVLSASWRDDKIAWYENDGSENFTPHNVNTPDTNGIAKNPNGNADGARSVFAADVDGDGDIDVLSASSYDDKIAWYENDGSERFTAHTISTDADEARSVFAVDVDGDGDIDVLSASSSDDKIAWYENDGSGVFTARTISTAAGGAVSVFAADVDGDGDMDVLSASRDDDTIAWYEVLASADFGDAPASFPTRFSDNRAFHAARGPTLGATRDSEPDGQPTAGADGDGLDEDGVTISPITAGRLDASLTVNVQNAPAGARLDAWIDFNGDGIWNERLERIADNLSVSSGNNIVVFEVPSSSAVGMTYGRFRLSTAGNLPASGPAADGEVEDYLVSILPFGRPADFGDAPAPYPTRLSEGGAVHDAAGPTLGETRDIEDDAQPTDRADGDGDDEDGVLFGSLRVGQLAVRVTVTIQNAPDGARLDAWIDFNADGSWGSAGEQIFDRVSVNDGENVLLFDVPSWAASGNTYARFRLSSVGDLGIGGLAADGEVEDYRLTIDPPAVATGEFGGPNTISISNRFPSSVFAVDIDGDGDVDVIAASSLDSRIAWYENDGRGRFKSHNFNAAANRTDSVFAADLDGDGDIDLLTSSFNYHTIAWYENDGNQNFTDHIISTDTRFPGSVSAADVDGDGDLDVLVAFHTDDTIAWYENDGKGNFTVHAVTTDADGAGDVLAADVDGDGDMDVIGTSSGDDTIAWYENDGSEEFTAHTIGAVNGPTSVFAADLDGDGDLDVLSASSSGFNFGLITWWENDGSEGFTGHRISSNLRQARSVFAADLDGDGDIDVLSASSRDDKIAWYENDGGGGFTSHTISTAAIFALGVFAADMDGDGDLDVLSASGSDSKIAWYENANPAVRGDLTGNTFVDSEDLEILLANWNQNVSAAEGNLVDPAGSPVNFEDLTVLLAAWTRSGPVFDFGDAPAPYRTTLADDGPRHEPIGPTLGATRDAEGNGRPSAAADGDGADEDGVTFGEIRVGQLAASVTVNVQNAPGGARLDAWIDFNADGAWGGPGEQILNNARVHNGDNVSLFDVPSWATAGDTYARFRLRSEGDVGLGGWVEDGEVEDYLITIQSPAPAIRLFSGRNTISNSAARANSVFAADVDGDGDMDVLSTSSLDDKITWYENDGNARFIAHTVSTDMENPSSVFATDLDGDGDVDVLSASSNDRKIVWYENDGNQRFTDHTISSRIRVRSVFTADLDGDGDMDVLAGTSEGTFGRTGSVYWYENNGSEQFAARRIVDIPVVSVFAADVDGDGDIDVLIASFYDDKIAWYENNGKKEFIAHTISTAADGAKSVFAVDMDGDGDMDVLSASSKDDKIAWYENDGSQSFTAHTISTAANSANSVFAADMDGDGDIDVLSDSPGDDEIAWYENDGSEGFTAHRLSNSADGANSVFVADVDGDGDLDVLSASAFDNTIAWYENVNSAVRGDLTSDAFVDFKDLTVMLAHWNQNALASEGNLVDPAGSVVDFEDLTVLLAAWTGPGAAGAPVGRGLAAAREAVGGDAVGDASYRRRDETTRRTADDGRWRRRLACDSPAGRRCHLDSRPADGIYGRLQAVDRVMAELDTDGAGIGRRANRLGRVRRR